MQVIWMTGKVDRWIGSVVLTSALISFRCDWRQVELGRYFVEAKQKAYAPACCRVWSSVCYPGQSDLIMCE